MQKKAFALFQDGLTMFEKIIVKMAIAYIRTESELCEKDIELFGQFLHFDINKLKIIVENKAEILNADLFRIGDMEFSKCDFKNEYELFQLLLYTFRLYSLIDQIDSLKSTRISEKSLTVFSYAEHLFTIINARLGAMEAIESINKCRNYVSSTIFSDALFPSLLDMIKLYYYSEKDCHFSMICLTLISYDLFTRTNVLYLILVMRILKVSEVIQDKWQNMSEELYHKFYFLFKNAHIIFLETNSNLLEVKQQEKRKKQDNTTRLQIFYSYSNYDAYVLRLDFAHMGVDYVHYNNSSPGDMKCFLLSKKDIEAIFSEGNINDDIEQYFIEYSGEQIALKEKCNVPSSKKWEMLYNKLRETNEHIPVFINSYSEKDLQDFLQIFNCFFPLAALKLSENEGIIKDSFNLDRLAGYMFCVYLAYLSGDKKSKQDIVKDFIQKAIQYGIIADSSEGDYTMEDLVTCIDLLQEKFSKYCTFLNYIPS